MRRPPKRHTFSNKFSFIDGSNYVVAEITSNPLITGSLDHVDAKHFQADHGSSSSAEGPVVQLALPDLMRAKEAFEEHGGQMSMAQFVSFFASNNDEPRPSAAAPAAVPEILATRKAQLAYLFMRVDCDSDGTVTWQEFLSHSLCIAEERSRQLDAGTAGAATSEASGMQVKQTGWACVVRSSAGHREAISRLVWLPHASAYLSVGREPRMHVWSAAKLAHERAIPVADNPMVHAHVLCVLHGLAKLAVVDSDDVLTFYELNDSKEVVAVPRWGAYGRSVSLRGMPHTRTCGGQHTLCLPKPRRAAHDRAAHVPLLHAPQAEALSRCPLVDARCPTAAAHCPLQRRRPPARRRPTRIDAPPHAEHGVASLAAWTAERSGSPEAAECLAVGCTAGPVILYNARTLLALLRPSHDPLASASVDASLVKTSRSGRIVLSSVKAIRSARLERLELHEDQVAGLDYHPPLRSLISCSYDKTLKVSRIDFGVETGDRVNGVGEDGSDAEQSSSLHDQDGERTSSPSPPSSPFASPDRRAPPAARTSPPAPAEALEQVRTRTLVTLTVSQGRGISSFATLPIVRQLAFSTSTMHLVAYTGVLDRDVHVANIESAEPMATLTGRECASPPQHASVNPCARATPYSAHACAHASTMVQCPSALVAHEGPPTPSLPFLRLSASTAHKSPSCARFSHAHLTVLCARPQIVGWSTSLQCIGRVRPSSRSMRRERRAFGMRAHSSFYRRFERATCTSGPPPVRPPPARPPILHPRTHCQRSVVYRAASTRTATCAGDVH